MMGAVVMTTEPQNNSRCITIIGGFRNVHVPPYAAISFIARLSRKRRVSPSLVLNERPMRSSPQSAQLKPSPA
jgi:hypothetical protein